MQDDFLIEALDAREVRLVAACLGVQLFGDDDESDAAIFNSLFDKWDEDTDK